MVPVVTQTAAIAADTMPVAAVTVAAVGWRTVVSTVAGVAAVA